MSITYIIIGITVLISMISFSNPKLLRALMMNPYTILHNRQYYRFLTSGFVHINHMHLLFNMFSFYFFGTAVEQIFNYIFGADGPVYFISLYVLSIIVSDLPTFFKQRNNPSYNSLGASGAVAAVIFAFIIFQPLQDICVFIALCMPGFILGILFVGFSYYQGKRSRDAINHEAHLYGALFGLLFCVLVYPNSIHVFWTQLQQWKYFH